MADRPKKIVVDCATNTSIEVELTDEEIAFNEEQTALSLAYEAEQKALEQAKVEAKASALAKLQTLGLTEDEAIALIG